MPFITQVRRDTINDGGYYALDEIQPGDRCYVHYEDMVRKWKANPRWTTAHEIFKNLKRNRENVDELVAENLAWQVFFQIHVMPYELRKREENGDV